MARGHLFHKKESSMRVYKVGNPFDGMPDHPLEEDLSDVSMECRL